MLSFSRLRQTSLTNEKRVLLQVLTNEKRVLRVLTNHSAALPDGDEAGRVEVAAVEEVELGEGGEVAEEGGEGERGATLTNEKRVLRMLTNQSPALPDTRCSPPSHARPRHCSDILKYEMVRWSRLLLSGKICSMLQVSSW